MSKVVAKAPCDAKYNKGLNSPTSMELEGIYT